ncbi:hypothetical protein BF17_18205 [Yersinia similis]|uniref:Uncharacterized protein n=1 Tax=Yersinia similis TaxID=367190 RepID=A0ABN4CT92_9GAMM|nr:hypothetical protein BF17_18205 [Yersinia similis]
MCHSKPSCPESLTSFTASLSGVVTPFPSEVNFWVSAFSLEVAALIRYISAVKRGPLMASSLNLLKLFSIDSMRPIFLSRADSAFSSLSYSSIRASTDPAATRSSWIFRMVLVTDNARARVNISSS